MENLQTVIEQAWANRDLLQDVGVQDTIKQVVSLLNEGKVRVAEPTPNGWQVNDWIKKAVIMYFPIMKMETMEVGPFEF